MENHYLQEKHRSVRFSWHPKVNVADNVWFGFCL